MSDVYTPNLSTTVPDLQDFLGGKNLSYLSKRTPSYPHKIFSLAETNLPGKVNDLFSLCAYFFTTNSLVHPVIYKMSEYPITKFKYTSGDERDQQRTKALIEDHWKGRHHLIETGLYYHAFGNCFTMVIGAAKRYIKCPKCGVQHLVTNFPFKWRDFKPFGECLAAGCRFNGEFKFIKIHPRAEKYVRLVMLDPRDVTIKYNPVTGSRVYLYRLPADVQSRIRRGDPYILEDIPDVFIDAVKQRRQVKIDEQALFHFHRPGLTASNDGYGMPLIAAVMQDIFYQKTLRRAQEAISLQHIVPLMILFPQDNANVQHAVQHNMADWRKNVEENLTRWKRDPNHIPIMPLPVGVELVGGNARALLITPELEQINSTIINGMLAPREIVEGGLSWSGSSISLRMVENHFLNYRNDIQEFLRFATDKSFSYLGWNTVNVEMHPFRMADDVQRLQLLMATAESGIVSSGRVLDEMDIDPDEDHKRRMEEMENSLEYSVEQAKQQAIAEGEGGIKAAEYQAKQQKALEDQTAEQASQEAGTPLDDPEALAQLIAEIIANSSGEVQQYAMQQLAEMPTLGAMVQQHLMALYGNPDAEADTQAAQAPAGTLTDEEATAGGPAFSGGPADPSGGGAAVGAGGEEVSPGMPEQLPPRGAGRL